MATMIKEPRLWCEIPGRGKHTGPLNIACSHCGCPPEREDGSSINSIPSTRAPSQSTVATSQASESSSSRAGVTSTQSDIDLTVESPGTSQSDRVVPIISPQKAASTRYEPNLSSNGGAQSSIGEFYRQLSSYKTQEKDRSRSQAGSSALAARPQFAAAPALPRSFGRGNSGVKIETFRFKVEAHVYWYDSRKSTAHHKEYPKAETCPGDRCEIGVDQQLFSKGNEMSEFIELLLGKHAGWKAIADLHHCTKMWIAQKSQILSNSKPTFQVVPTSAYDDHNVACIWKNLPQKGTTNQPARTVFLILETEDTVTPLEEIEDPIPISKPKPTTPRQSKIKKEKTIISSPDIMPKAKEWRDPFRDRLRSQGHHKAAPVEVSSGDEDDFIVGNINYNDGLVPVKEESVDEGAWDILRGNDSEYVPTRTREKMHDYQLDEELPEDPVLYFYQTQEKEAKEQEAKEQEAKEQEAKEQQIKQQEASTKKDHKRKTSTVGQQPPKKQTKTKQQVPKEQVDVTPRKTRRHGPATAISGDPPLR